MKRIIKLCCIFLSILFCVCWASCTLFVSAYSYEDAMNDYKKAFEDETSLDEIQSQNNLDYLTKSSGELYEIPNLSYDEWLVLKDRDTKRLDEVVKAVSNPSLSFLDTMGVVPFASNSKGASCDKRVAFFDYYRKMYFVIEYNSYYGEVFLSPDYSTEDSYFFWVNFRLYYNDNNTHIMFQRIGSSWYGDTITPDLGYTESGEPLWVFYVYAFASPTDYNSSAQVSFGDTFGSVSRGQDTSVSNHFKVGQYWYNSRFRIMPIYVDSSNSSTTAVIVGHSTAPACAGLFLYSDDTLRITRYGTGEIVNQTIDHSGKITGSVSVNGHNIYNEYQSYIVNGYNYWLFANFVDNYNVDILNDGDYGIFTGLYNAIFLRLDYFSSYVLPQGSNAMATLVSQRAQETNAIIDLFITSSNSSIFWFFTIILGFALIFLVIRVVVYITRW